MPAGFHRLIAAQFASALADNALLIVTIALLQDMGEAGWWAPLLKFGFTLSYVILAPVIGPLADAFPKAKLMARMNGIKTLGVAALLMGVHPVLAFVIVGLGAAAYAPAKYGLITELVPPRQLVAANGWVEVSVVGAALLGSISGGALLMPWLRDSQFSQLSEQWLAEVGLEGAGSLGAALLVLLGIYAIAALLNLGIPDSGARYPASSLQPRALVRDFVAANRTLWRDRDGGLSMAVTTLFWGVGATLQFAVLRWGADVLQLPLARASFLQAAVAVGVVVGAAIAGRWIRLHHARHVLPAGIVLGLLMASVASVTHWMLALPVLAVVGAVGGILVVPLNALLQHRGHTLLSAGRSIAVQGFNENASVLAMLAAYAALLALDVSIVPLMWGFGVAIALAIAALMWRERSRTTAAPVAAPDVVL